MVTWNLPEIARLMAARGIPTRKALGAAAGLSMPTAYNVTASGPLSRLDVPTFEALVRVLKPDSPWDLLTYSAD